MSADTKREQGPSDHGEPALRQRELLARILEETLVAAEGSETPAPEEMGALIEVARRHRGEPLSLDPITVDLVEAMLSSYFSGWSGRGMAWRPMSRDVAKTLFEDPVLRGRMEKLWHRLGEVST